MFHEYPKALYRAGELRIVADGDDEATARRDGFDDWQADQAPVLAAEKSDEPTPAKRKAARKEA